MFGYPIKQTEISNERYINNANPESSTLRDVIVNLYERIDNG